MCLDRSPMEPILYNLLFNNICVGQFVYNVLRDGKVPPTKPFGLNKSGSNLLELFNIHVRM